MTERIAVRLDRAGSDTLLGHLRRIPSQGGELVSFAYAAEWLAHPDRFEIGPALPLTPGEHYPPDGRMFGAIGDSAPDRWGRDLMRLYERRSAEIEGRPPRTLQEADYLLGVDDASRMGAMRFQDEAARDTGASGNAGAPGPDELGRLMTASDRIQTDMFDDDDLAAILAPGSSLGGARPKASVTGSDGSLTIAKFPKADDRIDIELWEAVALTLAEEAGLTVAPFTLKPVGRRNVLLSQRFDRRGEARLPFISAMALTGHSDGDEDASYLEIADVITRSGARPERDPEELFARIGFSILISNVDDHMRNHGFIRTGTAGWDLSPAYDINPVPPHAKDPILSTCIDFDDRTADPDLLLSTAEEYGLKQARAREILCRTAGVTGRWREIARRFGAREAEITEMAGAFEHERRSRALAL
ncbi:hypothetical protein OCH239_10850 [Roseivivax halodurans JCM 10272]|uniref:Phosphatidylinositol kinase n=1 Tax=Roseivivax halodurans JCM 10272 TaxID=1449350 RepID=X7EDY1_9RHOB|nr:type II toxin-antitoxin system HipA family toxin [Roseivivax halodurans]ETX13333.1 hypothetical protein OCH239_10850 [Roseivivax halodurans JCM 10272]